MGKKKRTGTPNDARIRLCLMWHQHQPYYRVGRTFRMPWVWLHATKDYLEMVQHLEHHPRMYATINLVPSLLKQLEEYLDGSSEDPVLELMTKPAERLSDSEKRFMLEHFFMANPSTVIARSPRYHELYVRAYSPDADPLGAYRHFSEQDYRDLAVHYSLAWTGEIARGTAPFSTLVEKDREFTEDDKTLLMEAQRANVSSIVDAHRTLAERGQIELTTTPFYHPILPLLINNESAREAMPDVSLPLRGLALAAEAEEQVARGTAYFADRLGRKPRGMWPSEGSLSEATLSMLAKRKIQWTATDEAVLARSEKELVCNGITIRPEHAKYFPWSRETEHGPITVFFRDHRLSDNIGFTYQSWSPTDAVGDFLAALTAIRSELLEAYGPEVLQHAVIPVILDGENCWEYYQRNGFEFLDGLYAALEDHPLIEPATFGDTSKAVTNKPRLVRLSAGSWINANFRIWIGHPEDNAAWDALAEARIRLSIYEDRMKSLKGAARVAAELAAQQAHEELRIAEGSDWCWWYGDDHFSIQKEVFDELFRTHVRAVYVLLDLPVPTVLEHPIPLRPEIHELYKRPSELMERMVSGPPRLSGKLLNDSWLGIPNQAPAKIFGAMHRSQDMEIEDLKIVKVADEVLLRLVLSKPITDEEQLQLAFVEPPGVVVRVNKQRGAIQTTFSAIATVASTIDEVVEIAIPHAALNGTKRVAFSLELLVHTRSLIRIPEEGLIECEILDLPE